jgi:hypothetical protein
MKRGKAMTRKFALVGAVVSLAVAQAASAQQITKPLSALSSNYAVGKISCHGVNNVPLTADRDQSLPLQLVAKLKCGEQVSVVTDGEDYTIGVRTADGKNGYVARIYLLISADDSARPAHQVSSATVQNGIARWQPGGAGSDQFSEDDSVVESLTVNGVTVQVSLHDTGWKMRANVAVTNANTEHVYVNPARFTLEERTPVAKSLPYQDPHKLVNAATHQILWTNASAYAPEGQWSQPSASVVSTSYKMPASTNASQALFSAPQNTTEPKEAVFKEGPVAANGTVSGAAWFERDKKAGQLVLRVPVDGVVFEFPFSFNHDK